MRRARLRLPRGASCSGLVPGLTPRLGMVRSADKENSYPAVTVANTHRDTRARRARSHVAINAARGHRERITMLSLAGRFAKTISDATIGTVIVLMHVALAERENNAERRSSPHL